MIFEDSSLLLFIILFLITILTLIMNGKDIIHPASIFSMTMTWSVLLTLIMRHQWNLSVSLSATIVITTSILVFVTGSFWSDKMLLHNIGTVKQEKMMHFSLSWGILFLVLIIMAIFVVLTFRDTYLTSLALGNQNGVAGMIQTVRAATESEILKSSRWISYRTYFSCSFTYVCILFFFCNIFYNHESVKNNLKFLLPILFYLPLIILSGGRMELLNLAIYILLTGSIFYEKSYRFNNISRNKVVIASLVAGAGFFCLFLFFGFFTGKVSLHGRGPFEVIAHYGGLSAPALSVYLNSISLESPYIGLTTLWEFYNKLYVLGFHLPDNIKFLDFVQFKGVNTNVYTAMRRYIEDFGFGGMYLIMFFLGMFYTAFYRFIEYKSHSNFLIAVYASIALPLFFSINEEIFLTHILRMSSLYRILLMYLIYHLFVKYSGSSTLQ